ncbi:hypothetical protein JHK87_050653 [Glycine soja]|nr:hypothetical protein JHK87_050653 [Glycine soja]
MHKLKLIVPGIIIIVPTPLPAINGTKLRVADFVHGADGLGNQSFPPPKGKPIEESAAAFFGSSSTLAKSL